MIFSADSPFRNLPAALDPVQAFFFEGQRFAIEMSDVAFRKLANELLRVSTTGAAEPGVFASVLLEAWAMVDSLDRLRSLTSQFPGAKRGPGGRHLLRVLRPVRDLRNDIQHLEQRIRQHQPDRTIVEGGPLLGSVSWIYKPDTDVRRWTAFALCPGSRHLGVTPIVNPMGRTMTTPIGLIELTAFDKTISLSDLVDETRAYAAASEPIIAEQFQGYETLSGDMLLRMDAVALPDEADDNPSSSS